MGKKTNIIVKRCCQTCLNKGKGGTTCIWCSNYNNYVPKAR